VRRITPDGIIHTVAGGATAGFSGDGGPASAAQLNSPWGISLGPDGSMYIADSGNHRIRRVSPEGIITTFAGTGSATTGGDNGQADLAPVHDPRDALAMPDGSIYIAQRGRLRRVDPTGRISTVAGGISGPAPAVPGRALESRLAPSALA